jgi:hypothetical protein
MSEVFARLTVKRGAKLNAAGRRLLVQWLRESARQVSRGEIDQWADRYTARVWTGRGVGWSRTTK